jgi:hypothetical protein
MKKTLLLIAILLTNIVSFAQIPSYIDTTALKAWYPFTKNTVDSFTGNVAQPGVSHAPYYVAPTLAVDRHGDIDKAYEFHGQSPDSLSKSYIDLGNTLFATKYVYSVSLWFRKTINVKDAYLISSHNAAFAIGVDNDNLFVITSTNFQKATTQGIFDTNWHHIVCIIDNDKVKLYLDDSLKIDINNATPSTPSKMLIGFNNFNGTLNSFPIQKNMTTGFRGRIDDIAIWNRTLTRAEVSELYNAVDTPKNVSVNEVVYNNPDISIAPNPAHNTITVKHTRLITNVEIYNMTGRLVYRNNPNTKLTKIDISNMAHGTYIVKVNNSISKILKQ